MFSGTRGRGRLLPLWRLGGMTDAAAGLHRRARGRGGVAGGGTGAAAGTGGRARAVSRATIVARGTIQRIATASEWGYYPRRDG
jgi:hypothetical protein